MKTIIFDFDGTIADSFEVALDIAYKVTKIPRDSDEEIERLRHMPLAKIVRELHIPLHRVPRLVIVGRQKMHERLGEVRVFPGIATTLKKLHDDGNRLLVISSNSEQNVRSFLRTHDLEQYFSEVHGNASALNKGASLKKVIRKDKIDTKTCFYVGDEVRDIAAASKAGIEPVSVTWGYQAPEALAQYHPFALVKKPEELLAVFGAGKV
ncbi:MAG TPA: HAD-IA family hydrolase [Candidatus Saccharimonadales bacterium]